MWNKDKSVILSQCIVKAVYVFIFACCIAAPFIVGYYDEHVVMSKGGTSVFVPLIVTLYCTAPPSTAAMVCLDLLLHNIRNGNPFIQKNVRYLRIISYCCFAVSVIFVYFSFLRPLGFAVVFAAAFFGLIIRVVKNCFEQAVAIREENDFTV